MGTVDRNRSNRQEEMAAVKSKIFIVVGAFLLLWFARFVWDYFDPTIDANQAMQIQLKVFGSAMYEYHAATKRWPTKLDDLAQTSLPKRSYIWQQTATTMVFSVRSVPAGMKGQPYEVHSRHLCGIDVGSVLLP